MQIDKILYYVLLLFWLLTTCSSDFNELSDKKLRLDFEQKNKK